MDFGDEINNNNSEEDLFDRINNLTKNAYDEGYRDGEINGKKAAILEGFKTGIKTSIALNSEIGYYQGICEQYMTTHQSKSTATEIRIFNLAKQISDLILKIDLNNPKYDNLFNDLNHIRDKFKQFCSLTNFKSDFKISYFNTQTDSSSSARTQAMRLNF